MRFLVTGGRKFDDQQMVRAAFSRIPAVATLVHGAAPGADSLCARIWSEFGNKVEEHPANWPLCEGPNCHPEHRKVNKWGKEYCPTAGHLRNQKMVDSGVDFLLAFPGETGTRDCIDRALKKGLKVIDASTGERLRGEGK